jgi:hypothetical protein
LALCLLPAAASAAGEEFEGVAGAFTLKASNGYRLLVLASSRHADGRGEVVIFATRRDGGVSYFADATVTETGIEADLGSLGKIDVAYVPTGAKQRLHSPCSDDAATFEKADYRGTIEFHGEEGYTDAIAFRVPVDNSIWVSILCPGAGSGETRGPGLPGARLAVRPLKGPASALEFQVMKNRPTARTRIGVSTKERRGGIEIRRSLETLAGPAAFRYDPSLRTATVGPPAPFAGSATFDGDAKPADRWTGNLTVDLPGRSKVPLAGAATRANLVHARWTRSNFQYE